MSTAENKAVFLSYASQDAEAAKRICEALRAAGVEVWFDQNELVGGDAWDAKIRGQIASCALFVPVISAATQARREGYFRLEWKLAAQRTHMLADGTPFLLPVVIDDTRDAAALVPPEFKVVQWTRFAPGPSVQHTGGNGTEGFARRVKTLLGDEAPLAGDAHPEKISRPDKTVRLGRSWLLPVVLALAVLAGLAAWRIGGRTGGAAENRNPTVGGLLDRAGEIFRTPTRARFELETAAQLCRQAIALDPLSASAWALSGRVDAWRVYFNFDNSLERREAARSAAEKAVQLAPGAFDSKLAQAAYVVLANQHSGAVSTLAASARASLRELYRQHPTDPEVVLTLALLERNLHDRPQTRRLFEELARLPGYAAVAYTELGWAEQGFGEPTRADAAARQAVAAQAYWNSLTLDADVAVWWWGDLKRAQAALDRMPASALSEDAGVSTAVWHAQARGEFARVHAILAGVPREWLQSNFFEGPVGYFVAVAHAAAGQAEAARQAATRARDVVESRLAAAPNSPELLIWKARLQSMLGDPAANQTFLLFTQLSGGRRLRGERGFERAADYWMLGERDAGLTLLENLVRQQNITWGDLAVANELAAMRSHPRFQALLADAKADPKLSPYAAAQPAGQSAAAPEKSLVVLPLENLSPDPENAFFTDGMHAEIIATLQRTTDLRVIGRDSALAFKRGSTTVAEFAQRLGVTNVLTGSVRRAGTKARVLVELRRASDDALLWSSPNAERELTDLWAVQSEVAEQVARALKARETVGSNAHARYLTKNPQAVDLFVKADQRFFAGEFAQAIPLYVAAFELDRSYVVPAYMLVHAYCNLCYAETEPGARVRYAEGARQWLEEVARLDPNGFGAIAQSHYASNVEEDNLLALDWAEKGMRALPNENAAPTFHALALDGLGRMAEALESYRRANRLDPLLVFSLQNEARALVFLRREPEAMVLMDRVTSIVGVDRSFDGPAQSSALHSFRLRGALPQAIETIPGPRERAVWSHRARLFAEAERAAASAASQTGISDPIRFELLVLRHDALRRLNRRADAEAVARDLSELARRLQGTPDLGPSRKAGWLAVAEARAGRADEAIKAARRFVEDAAPGRQQAVRWQREVALAGLYAYLNRPRECCELLAKLLLVPSGLTVPMLKIDPIWDNVREDAAFKALLADPKNSAPL